MKFFPIPKVSSVLAVFNKMVTKLEAIQAEQGRRAAYFVDKLRAARDEEIAAANAVAKIKALIA